MPWPVQADTEALWLRRIQGRVGSLLTTTLNRTLVAVSTEVTGTPAKTTPKVATLQSCPRTSVPFVRKPDTGKQTAQQENRESEFMAGSLSSHADFWNSLNCSEFVKSVVGNGLRIPFNGNEVRKATPRSYSRHVEFIEKEIDRLLISGAVARVSNEPLVCSPLHVAISSSGKQRLILDLSILNENIKKTHVKFDDVQKIRFCLPKGGFMAQFDLKNGYHQILIDPEDRQLLGFTWGNPQQFYQFNALPFGLCTGPAAFTKVFRALVQRWRSKGVQVAMYLDDGLIWAETREECEAAVKVIREDLSAAGAIVNEGKSQWEPVQKLIWLGFEIDLESFLIKPSVQRMELARKRLSFLINSNAPTIHDRQKWAGTLASLHLIIGDGCTRDCRRTEIAIAEEVKQGRDVRFPVVASMEEKGEWERWMDRLKEGLAIQVDQGEDFSFDCVLFCDASETGLGAVLKYENESVRSFTPIPENFLGSSSTLRELLAVSFGIEAFAKLISGKRLLLKTDNSSAVTIIRKGSMKLQLQEIAEKIWGSMRASNVNMKVKWVPRDLNTEADSESREVDYDSWSINRRTFAIVAAWENISCDFFADHVNNKCEKFFSRHWCPGSTGVNAFEQEDSWKDEIAWWVPPVYLVPKVIVYAKKFGARGILGCPWWEAQPYLNMLLKKGHWIGAVKRHLILPAGAKLFEKGCKSEAFEAEFTKFPFLFVLLDFSQ